MRSFLSTYCRPLRLFAAGLIVVCSGGMAYAQEAMITSPDKATAVKVTCAGGRLQYGIERQGQPVLQPSALGLSTSAGNFESNIRITGVSRQQRVQESYRMVNAKRSNNSYTANEVVVSCANEAGRQMQVIFRVSNDGVAFRYYLPWVNGSMVTITKEHTTYTMDAGARAWLQPMSQAKSGWEQCHPSYEEHYQQNIAVGTLPLHRAGWVYPALFNTGSQWLLISEAGMDGSYCGTRLVNDSGSSVYQVGFPDAREVFTGKGYLPQAGKPFYSPWRILCIGGLNTIIESTLGTDLAPAAIAHDPSFIKPGKASWSWINSKDDFIVYDEQKRYIDFAANMQWQYCLIDVDWDTKIGYEKIKELADYAATKQVGLLLWYNSAGDWNTVKYHPKDLLLTHEGRTKEFARLQAMGIKGVKIDFFGGDGQSMMQYYIDILNDAARYKLLVNFHGATLPRGWHKTYPHLMTTEAIYGMEMVTFGQEAADAQPAHCAVIPFTRNAFDPMDFTPMNLYKLTHSKSVRRTTSGFELALSVLFLSGIQHYAENPDGMSHVPAFARQFLQTLPNHWDDVKFIDGYPGKFVIVARKSGSKWYVAGINGQSEAKRWTLDLSALSKTKGILIKDAEGDSMFEQQAIQLAQSKALDIEVKPNGGFVLVLD